MRKTLPMEDYVMAKDKDKDKDKDKKDDKKEETKAVEPSKSYSKAAEPAKKDDKKKDDKKKDDKKVDKTPGTGVKTGSTLTTKTNKKGETVNVKVNEGKGTHKKIATDKSGNIKYYEDTGKAMTQKQEDKRKAERNKGTTRDMQAGEGMFGLLNAASAAKSGTKVKLPKGVTGQSFGKGNSTEKKSVYATETSKKKNDRKVTTTPPATTAAATPAPAATVAAAAPAPADQPVPWTGLPPTARPPPKPAVDPGPQQGASRGAAASFRGSRQTGGGGGNTAGGGDQGVTTVASNVSTGGSGKAENRKGQGRGLRFV